MERWSRDDLDARSDDPAELSRSRDRQLPFWLLHEGFGEGGARGGPRSTPLLALCVRARGVRACVWGRAGACVCGGGSWVTLSVVRARTQDEMRMTNPTAHTRTHAHAHAHTHTHTRTHAHAHAPGLGGNHCPAHQSDARRSDMLEGLTGAVPLPLPRAESDVIGRRLR